jgi:hypothetical protein
MSTGEKFRQECKEFDEQAEMVMDYAGAFDKCLAFLREFRCPELNIGLLEKQGWAKMIKDLHGIKWPVDEVTIHILADKMLKHFSKKDEFEKCIALKQVLENTATAEPSEARLCDFWYRVHVIYTFPSNCQVLWEEYDGWQEWGIFNTGMFSFALDRTLADTTIDGTELIDVLLEHFQDIGKHKVCIDLKKLRDQLEREHQREQGRSYGSSFEDGMGQKLI